jgi:hypothetical protein
MKKRFSIIIKYLFIFSFFLFWNLIIARTTMDEVWSYGFSYNISKGLIPYKDFNMVIPPFYPILFSLPLLINSNLIVFHICNSIILCIIYYLLEKLLNKNKYIPIFFMMFPLSIISPTYNIFLLFLYLIIIYLEKEYNSYDYLIGFIIGLIILTKHSVGIFLIIPSILYYKDLKKLLKRFIGLIIPLIFCLIYLLINKTLKEFINLTILGLFDFASNNSHPFNIYFFISIILLIFNIYKLQNKNKRYLYLYSLSFYSIVLPIFDLNHLIFYFISLLVSTLIDYNFKIKLNIPLFFKGLILGIYLLSFYTYTDFTNYPNTISKFEYRNLDSNLINYSLQINKAIKKYNTKEIVFISSNAYYFKLINNIKINYYDLINSGNLGYNGNNKIINNFKLNKNKYIFFVDDEIKNNKYDQTDKKIYNYIINNGTKIDTIYNFSIYTIS